jgi:hypothetical protein
LQKLRCQVFCSVLVGFVLSLWPTWQSLVTIWSHDIMNSWWQKRALVACLVAQSVQAVSRSSVPPFGLLAPFRFMVLVQPTSSSTAPPSWPRSALSSPHLNHVHYSWRMGSMLMCA